MQIQITINTEDEQAIPSILRDVASQLDDPATQDKERMDGSLTLKNEQYQAHVQPFAEGGMWVVSWTWGNEAENDAYSRHDNYEDALGEYNKLCRYKLTQIYSVSLSYEIKSTD